MADTADPSFTQGSDLATGITQPVFQQIGLWRQIVGTTALYRGFQDLHDATPESRRPPEFPGIRSYYPRARGLRGLTVASNWQVSAERYDADTNNTPGADNAGFILYRIANPHPGARTLMYGDPETPVEYPHYQNPDGSYFERWPRKTARRMARNGNAPLRMTTWQSLVGRGKSTFPLAWTRPPLKPLPGFAARVTAIAEQWNTEAATKAFQGTQTHYVEGQYTNLPGTPLYIRLTNPDLEAGGRTIVERGTPLP